MVTILKMKLTSTPKSILSPLARIKISIIVLKSSITILQPIGKVTLKSIPCARYENPLAVHFISLPLAVIKRTIWEKHFSLSEFLIFKPLAVIDRSILVVINTITMSHYLSNILCTIKIMKLILNSFLNFNH